MPKEHSLASSGHQPTAEQDLQAAESIKKGLFKRHVLELFGHQRGGHMARWVYLDLKRGGDLASGSALWAAWVNASLDGKTDYYLTPQEIALIKHKDTMPKLRGMFGDVNRIVDFGSGNRYAVQNKAMPIVHGLGQVKVYTPFDISKMMLEEARAAANDNLAGMKNRKVEVEAINGDFSTGLDMQDGSPIILTSEFGKNRLGLFLGSTITNQEMGLHDDFPVDKIIENLNKFRLILNAGKDDSLTGEHGLIVGYDSNLNKESAEAAYIDPEGEPTKIWAPLVTGVMFDIARTLEPQPTRKNNGGFDPQGWHHVKISKDGPPLNPDDPNSPPAWIVVHQCVKADKEQDFKIEKTDDHGNSTGDWQRCHIKENEIFVIKNNFKFHPTFFRDLARRAKFDPLDTIQIPNNNAVLQPLRVSY